VIIEAGDNTGGKQLTQLASKAAFSGASNGYGSHSPNGFALGAVMITEVVVTALFVLVIVGTSVNPVRSLSTAVFANSFALEQLWVFIVFPIVGGLVAAGIWMVVTTPEDG
jgi:aquaporin Z